MLTSATASDQGTHAFLHVSILEIETPRPVGILDNKLVDQPALFMGAGVVQQPLDRPRQFIFVLLAKAIFISVLVRWRYGGLHRFNNFFATCLHRCLLLQLHCCQRLHCFLRRHLQEACIRGLYRWQHIPVRYQSMSDIRWIAFQCTAMRIGNSLQMAHRCSADRCPVRWVGGAMRVPAYEWKGEHGGAT